MNHCWHVLPCSTFHNIIFLQHEHNEFLYPVRRSLTTGRMAGRGSELLSCSVTLSRVNRVRGHAWPRDTWQYVTTSARSVVSQSVVSLQRVCPVLSGPDLRLPPIHYEYWEWRHQYQEPFIYSEQHYTSHVTIVLCVYCVTCPRNRSGSLTIIQYQSPNNLINQLPIITSKWPKLGRLYKR